MGCVVAAAFVTCATGLALLAGPFGIEQSDGLTLPRLFPSEARERGRSEIAMPYHVLLARDHKGAPWCFYFGDYDREAVEFEKYLSPGSKLVALPSDTQEAIDRYTRSLNAQELAGARERLARAEALVA
jgi:hypothetical protein